MKIKRIKMPKFKDMTLTQLEKLFKLLVKEEKRVDREYKNACALADGWDVYQDEVGSYLDDLEKEIRGCKPPSKKERKAINKEIANLQAKLAELEKGSKK